MADFNPRFELFNLPGGEAANQVQCIIQDKVGFLWFGSRAGLIRYDGRHFLTYRHNPLDTNSIASDYVNWIFQDSKGILWLGHCCDGLSAFDPVTEKCVRYQHIMEDSNTLADNYVSMVIEDRQGQIWVATGNGLDCIAPAAAHERRGKIKHYQHSPNDRRSLSDNFARALWVDKRGTLWVGCGFPYSEKKFGGLNRYNSDDDAFTRYVHQPENINSLADNRVQVIFEDSWGHFWIGTSGASGLHLMNEADQRQVKFTRLPFDPAQPARLSGPTLRHNNHVFPVFEHITFISEDQQGRLWIGAVEGGLNVYDPAANAMSHFEPTTGVPNSLQAISLWHFCQAKDGSIWLSCGDNGPVFRVKNTNDLFPFYNARQSAGITNAIVSGILKDPAGDVWLQMVGNFTGVAHFDRKRKQYERFNYNPPVKRRAIPDFFELGTDRQGLIWASTEKGLYKMDPADEGHRYFRPDSKPAQKIAFDQIWPPYRDRNGNIWIATFGNGLYRFDAKMEKFVHFQHDPGDTLSIRGNHIKKVFEDEHGNLWVLGASIGIDRRIPMFFDRFDTVRQTFQHFLPLGELGSPSMAVEDKEGNFWFSAYPHGIRKVNPQKSGEYKTFTVTNSALATNLVTDMYMGTDGNIWMAAKDFIIQLDPETESFFTYTAHHGVQTSSFSWVTGSCIGADGEIFFGGEGGFHAFFPEKVHQMASKYPSRIYLTGLDIMEERVVPGEETILSHPIWETTELRLTHNRNVFSFHVATFEFGGPELTRMEYMLENYDRTWRNDLHEGEAAYVNVPPGKYVFRVRGINSVGIQAQEASIRVVVLPPWWQTWWAYALYTILIAGSLYLFYRVQLNRRLEHAETLRLQELDAVKSKLYTNITHEFRTPLTVILGMARQVLDNPKEHFRYGMEMIIRNGQNLLQLVNQMLDLSKLESGKLSLHLQQGNVVNFLKYLVESFHSLADHKNIQIHFINDAEVLVMDFDAERLQQVVSNLLSNALKFTPEGGQVYFSVGSGSQVLAIKVRDTGIGISEEHLPHIFDRFYQADDSQIRHAEGTGIGLALAKELVKLMEGDISVKSTPGEGTEFIVTLPVRQVATENLRDNGEWLWKSGKTEISIPLPPIAHPASAEKPLVLIAEDNADVVTYLASCLAGDYRLSIAKDGQECEAMAFDTIPDLIVTDVMMPRKDGFKVCETLKNDERTSHIPIILLTAKADTESKLEGLKHGADAYLMKPFHKEELLLRIHKLLELRQRLQRHYLTLAGLAEGGVVENGILPLSNIENAFVTKARGIVETHLDDLDFDVEKFCRELTLSHSQVHRKLFALTGFSANRFIRSVRLSKAKSLLMNPEISITAVAFDSGFGDPSYFGKIFKQEFGLTPLEWRAQHLQKH